MIERALFSPGPSLVSPYLTVERVSPDRIERVAADIQRIMRDAYYDMATRTFTMHISQTAVERHFNPESRNHVEQQARRMEYYMKKRGSTYWLAHMQGHRDGNLGRPIGVVKTSPSRPGLRKLVGQPNCYVNDIASTEGKRGVGSALLYTALDDFADNRSVVLDAFAHNHSANRWFGDLGFRAVRILDEATDIGGEPVMQIRMEAASVGGVRDELLARVPWLGNMSAELT